MRRIYASYLNKDMLLKSGITEITKDGRIFKGTRELKGIYNKQKKAYKQFTIYAFDKDGNKIKIPSKTQSYNYRITTVAFHRAIYAWFHNEVPEGMVVDHIDNDPSNNNIDNLQLLTVYNNLHKDVIREAKYIPPMAQRRPYTEEYLNSMISKWEVEAEKAKTNHDAKRYHNAMCCLSQWRRRLELFKGDKK
jgi:hypothetical protein